jgi:NTP pyrophosphatase (non-canonical NTP hydrolase)
MTIKQSQEKVDEWIHSTGIRYFSELTNMAILTEEVGELARIIARKYGDQSFKDDEANLDAGEEIADIFFVLLCLANQTGVDLTEEFKKGLKKRNRRDATRHLQNPKLKDNRNE